MMHFSFSLSLSTRAENADQRLSRLNTIPTEPFLFNSDHGLVSNEKERMTRFSSRTLVRTLSLSLFLASFFFSVTMKKYDLFCFTSGRDKGKMPSNDCYLLGFGMSRKFSCLHSLVLSLLHLLSNE